MIHLQKNKLCSRCKTGKAMYELDKSSPFCPYLELHNGKTCSMFVELEKEKSLLKKLLKK